MLSIHGRLVARKVSLAHKSSLRCFSSSNGLVSALPCQKLVRTSSLCRQSPVLSVSQRCYGSKFNENYILEQNSLSEAEKQKIHEEVKEDFKDWVPYGMCPTDKEEDIYRYKIMMFTGITVAMVLVTYFYVYMPKPQKRDWVSREAFLELERRRQLGLPLVDKNLIPEEQIVLPTLEELGDDYDIII